VAGSAAARAAAGTGVVTEVEETALVGRQAGSWEAAHWAEAGRVAGLAAGWAAAGWAVEATEAVGLGEAMVAVGLGEETEAATVTRVGIGSDRDLQISSRCSEQRAREILKWLPALESSSGVVSDER
jgi:hypothetical protein